jgi:hypothetical protein
VPSSTYIVNSTGDTGDGNGLNGDLRYCITQANSAGGSNLIEFDSAVFSTAQTITLTSALPAITDDTLAIFGPGNGLVTISGNNQFRVLQITAADATVDGLIITQGNGDNGGGIEFTGTGTLSLGDCTLSGNTASHLGGGLYSGFGQTAVTNSMFTGNSGYLNGGGIANVGTLTLAGCTVSGNSAEYGGGLTNTGTAILTDSTVSSNSATLNYGGGIYNLSGSLTLTNSVVSNNSAANAGGGVANFGGLALNHSSLSGNSTIAGPGGGLFNARGSNANVYGYSFVTGNSTTAYVAGGGIANYGTLTLTNATVSGNNASSYGGGIANKATLTLTNDTISGNSVIGDGGGISNVDGTVMVSTTTFSGNMTKFGFVPTGGGIWNTGMMTLDSSTVSGNLSAQEAGGIGNEANGMMTLTNSTISGNTGLYNGGILNYATLTLANATVSGNMGTDSSYSSVGGIESRHGLALTLNNTLVAGNTCVIGYPDVQGTVTSTSGFNLIGNGTGLSGIDNGVNGNQIGNPAFPINPLLSALGNYGGPTQTMGLLPGSPALDAGSNALAVDSQGHPLTTDQRGFARIVNGTVDIGAFESSGFSINGAGGNFQSGQVGQGFPNALMVQVGSAFNEPVAGGLVTFTAPANDASARLAPTQATLSSDGLASTQATANTVAGSYIVTASVNPHSTPFNFNLSNLPGPATQFQIVSTHSAKVNTPFSFKVRARDVYGNLATGYTGTVAFSSSDPLAVLPSPYAFTNKDQGAHCFMATLNTAGSQTLTATDASNSTITGQSIITVRGRSAAASGFAPGDEAGAMVSLKAGQVDEFFVEETLEPGGLYIGGR